MSTAQTVFELFDDAVRSLGSDFRIKAAPNKLITPQTSPPYTTTIYTCRCPSHQGRSANFSYWQTPTGGVGMICFVGCTRINILDSLRIPHEQGRVRVDPGKSGSSTRPRTTARPAERPAAHPEPRANGHADPRWAAMASRYEANLTPALLNELANDLGVLPAALLNLRTGYAHADDVKERFERLREPGWTFPMLDGFGAVSGVLLRIRKEAARRIFPVEHKDKLVMTNLAGELTLGSFVPSIIADADPKMPVLYVEGASDVAAAISHGYLAVGRPSNAYGAKFAGRLLPGRLVVMGENDAGEKGWPGLTGARATALELRNLTRHTPEAFMPPTKYKDLRTWLAERPLDQSRSIALADMIPSRGARPVDPRWAQWAGRFEQCTREDRFKAIAASIGGSTRTLRNLRAGYADPADLEPIARAPNGPAATFPIYGPGAAIVGVSVHPLAATPGRRAWYTATNSGRGVWMPLVQPSGPLHVVVGLEDTIAALDADMAVLGIVKSDRAESIALRPIATVLATLIGERDTRIIAANIPTEEARELADQLHRCGHRRPDVLIPPAGCQCLRDVLRQHPAPEPTP